MLAKMLGRRAALRGLLGAATAAAVAKPGQVVEGMGQSLHFGQGPPMGLDSAGAPSAVERLFNRERRRASVRDAARVGFFDADLAGMHSWSYGAKVRAQLDRDASRRRGLARYARMIGYELPAWMDWASD